MTTSSDASDPHFQKGHFPDGGRQFLAPYQDVQNKLDPKFWCAKYEH